MLDILIDALVDTLKLIPFLFLSFIVMEWIEHKLNNQQKLLNAKKLGPLAGSVLGIIPQCGFSALASNLYAARVISLGTLIAIYLSTSDEMLPILISNHASITTIIKILLTKFLLGLIFGFLIDLIYRKKEKNDIHSLCEDADCHCEKSSIIKSSLIHTLKISAFLLVITIILNAIIDKTAITNLISANLVLTPIITSIVGLIPNCSSSIIITKLYLENIISFGSVISGLLSSSGVGILILFRQNKNLKENIAILITLILIASTCGIILNLF